jgi:hypothetical protein
VADGAGMAGSRERVARGLYGAAVVGAEPSGVCSRSRDPAAALSPGMIVA